ncbi:unnamed protein product [Caenorhabditis angaria]|uniref:THSD1 third Ig-like domain-containing protein n=1 Tax=Caenorhabditis angaria TaxID=860376 RepID=A0A9P1J2Y9_9PELO|nr:unnamed protein product [Caenorhabditis angaria]
MKLLFLLLLSVVPCLNLPIKNNLITPRTPNANSQAYIETSNVTSQFTIHAANISSCRFRTAVIPCECFLFVGTGYRLEENDKIISNFAVGPPDVKIFIPSTHEMLNELSVHIEPKLCRPDPSKVLLEYRSFQVFPGEEETSWKTIASISKILKDSKTSLMFGCKHFADPGYYRVSIHLSLVNYTVQADRWIVVNRTNQNTLQMREDSIFPHCTSDYSISWNLAQCSMDHLHYRLRILSVPEDAKNREEEAQYIEEIGITRSQNSIKLSCSQFDIINEKYCFELVSVNKNSSISHTWQSICVSTEPVDRKIGGWSSWSEWSACSETCGSGRQRRVRYCNEPVPKRSKYCDGPLIETQECALSKCPEAMMTQSLATNCTCGCHLDPEPRSFFASSRHSRVCEGNQTWTLPKLYGTKIADFTVKKQGDAKGKLFFFLRAPYQELVWSSDSHQDYQFSLPMSASIHIVLWNKENETYRFSQIEDGFTVSYSIRDSDGSPTVAKIDSCQPFCPETMAIAFMAIIFICIIFVPPIVCAAITASMRRNSTPEVPLMDNKYDSEMIRSGNTETTHVSSRNYVAKRSIGIQLSVQSTPRTARACHSQESPVPPRGHSSLSECEELEYDYYDGTTFPGSLLAPVQDVMHSQIDIDQIIGQSELFINSSEKADVHTQI